LTKLQQELEQAVRSGTAPLELGFFGGTFTAIPEKWARAFLDLATAYRARGLITRIRCSTRPDRLCHALLQRLQGYGLDMVEIGAQTFSDRSLFLSRRGYHAQQIRQACYLVRDCGLQLGLQLLPGLPGHDVADWLFDVHQACAQEPEAVRIYPCLVLRCTELERLYLAGEYAPWDLDTTVRALSRGVLRFWRCGIRVIRMGLPPQPELLGAVLAGPWHPALGSMVRSRILLARIAAAVLTSKAEARPLRLRCPRSWQGDLFGFRSASKRRLARLGISSTSIVSGQGEDLVLNLEKRFTEQRP
jgi:histone acetyltransferase (RNA polymerase elongator complex component)